MLNDKTRLEMIMTANTGQNEEVAFVAKAIVAPDSNPLEISGLIFFFFSILKISYNEVTLQHSYCFILLFSDILSSSSFVT